MRSSVLRRLAVLAVSVSVAVSSWAAPSAAADPLFVGWASLIPALVYQYEPTSLDECVAGRLQCVDRTIKTMEKRFAPLAATCSHQAVFALAYLRTTEAYRRFTTTPGTLADPAFVNHQDAAFAQMYFDAYDAWTGGSVDRVPPAWRIAFGAADRRSTSGIGNLLLGMNAHVNRDLPFVLAGIGLVRPDGTSRKPDHDSIDVMLNGVVEPLIAEEAATLDPQIPLLTTPFGVGYTGLMQALVLWREVAWHFAEQLVSAPTPALRDLVAQQIEEYAATTARTIVLATSYLPPLSNSARRDVFCAGR